MTVLSHDLDESYVDRNEDDQIRGRVGITESLLLEDNSSKVSRNLPFLLVLTCGGAGLQVIWSVIRSNGAPYLVSLGLSKSLTALVWLAAPLCGVVVQPIVGILSDRTRSRWGRRKPFIVGGTIGVIVSTLALAFLTSPLSGDAQGQGPRNLVILLAIALIYAMNISIQPIQAGLRTLIIENCPAHQQTQAAAWTSVLMDAGHAIAMRQPLAAIETVNATPMMSADLTVISKENSIAEDAIRYGTFASFLFSIVAFATNLLLPLLLGFSTKTGLTTKNPPARFGISQAWTCAHIFFALAMFATMMVTSQAAATFLVASVGLSWALTHWAPFAIIGNELANELAARQSFSTSTNGFSNEEMSTVDVQPGAIMGLHNVAISTPQIVAALACSAIFGLAKSLGSQDGTGWVLRSGGYLISAHLTSRILSFSDEFFASASNLINPANPIRRPGYFVESGAWYDGWETRRHNRSPPDWVVIRLGPAAGIVKGVEIDTAFFDGNHAESVEVWGTYETGEEADERVQEARYEAWRPVLGRRGCGAGRRQAWTVDDQGTREVTHVKLCMYPDGGIARIRLYGVAVPVWPMDRSEEVELSSALMGGRVVGFSDEHFGKAGNVLMPGRGADMGDGWETKRSRESGHSDWVVVKLGARGRVRSCMVDTMHFRGNFPQGVRIEGVDAEGEELVSGGDERWVEVVGVQGCEKDKEHVFADGLLKSVEGRAFTHMKMTIIPDGGVKRFRVFGIQAQERHL
ncbi:MAG: Allantoicase [Alectoria fallacina]|uniref:Allantoicase n=1 Tax=Alectoria fallacina TaxID=1903189 RepID=A0A8H3I2U3_9LECA|nr:MAG: Allantoicase [Alectoria fallacina]